MLTQWRKTRLRRKASQRRAEAFADATDAARKLVDHFPDEIWPALHSVVAGYRAIGHEIDPTPLLETFHCEQARLALPCVVADDAALEFRAYSPGDELQKQAFGIEAPLERASLLVPTVVLVPLVAFDGAGQRLGYGGGYYDRTLGALRAAGPVTAVGLAFEAQRVNRIPTDRHDQRLDWVVTENAAIKV